MCPLAPKDRTFLFSFSCDFSPGAIHLTRVNLVYVSPVKTFRHQNSIQRSPSRPRRELGSRSLDTLRNFPVSENGRHVGVLGTELTLRVLSSFFLQVSVDFPSDVVLSWQRHPFPKDRIEVFRCSKPLAFIHPVHRMMKTRQQAKQKSYCRHFRYFRSRPHSCHAPRTNSRVVHICIGIWQFCSGGCHERDGSRVG